ncbi:MAG TPA: T9SS type A sorting domain-containing protein, partial [Flavobacteriales bacterium]|nr:T9SS type A sorting domain-containing protein [Flavobacteriales bacterium]
TPVFGVMFYQFEFADPNAGWIRRISLPRNWVKFGEMMSNPLVNGVTYYCRARADQGAAGFSDDHFGAGCELGLAPSQPVCTELISTPGSTFSCGATRVFGGSDKVWAQPVPYATQYRFRFTGNSFDPDGPGPMAPVNGIATRIVTQASYALHLSWYTYALVAGNTYDVTVEAKVGGVWGGVCGGTCQVTISGSSLMPLAGNDGLASDRALENNANVSLWPNPAIGGRVNLLLNDLGQGTHRVSVDLFDLSGKRLMAELYENDGEVFNTVLELSEGIATGSYMLHITVDGERHIERLNVTR